MVKEIEFYKIQNGKYPQYLKDIEPKGKPQGFVSIYDVSQIRLGDKEPKLFYYELVNGGTNYYLFSVGSDGKPFTKDDVYPVLDESQMKHIGYVRPDNQQLETTDVPRGRSSTPQP